MDCFTFSFALLPWQPQRRPAQPSEPNRKACRWDAWPIKSSKTIGECAALGSAHRRLAPTLATAVSRHRSLWRPPARTRPAPATTQFLGVQRSAKKAINANRSRVHPSFVQTNKILKDAAQTKTWVIALRLRAFGPTPVAGVRHHKNEQERRSASVCIRS